MLPSHVLPTEDAPQAALEGELEVSRQGCISVAGQDYVLFWPRGTRFVKDSPARIVDQDGAVMAEVGDTVRLGGASRDAYTDPVEDVSSPKDCVGPGFLVFNVTRL